MVTKQAPECVFQKYSSVLAKIHMVTKLFHFTFAPFLRSVLAKIHMVTKRDVRDSLAVFSSVLAKIHMVTKRANTRSKYF